MKNNSFALGHLAMLIFSILIAGSFSLGVKIANLMDPSAMMALRFMIAGVVVGAFVFFGPGIKKKDLQAPWRYLVLGGLFALYFTLMFEGLKTASAVSSAAVFTLTPVITAVFGYFILGQIITRWMALALAIGAAGAVWVIFGGDLGAMARLDVGRGEAIYFVGCVSHALYTPLVRKLNRGESTIVFTFGMIVSGCLLLGALSLPELLSTDWGALPVIFWIGLVYLAVCASAMTFFLLQFAVMYLPSANVMAYTYLTPAWVIVWELALNGTRPPAIILVGVVATFLALLMLLRRPAIKAEPA